MAELKEILNPLFKILSKSKVDNLGIISEAMLSMTGSKTMLNISRWTKGELSYRSIQRFYISEILPWLDLTIKLFMLNIFSGQNLILAVDETVVTKSGKVTYGLDYFFHSVYQKIMKSLCFSCISIIDTDKLKSYPLMASQLVFTSEEKLAAKIKKEKAIKAKGGKRGRKKGSKNSVKKEGFAPSFRLLKEQLEKIIMLIKDKLSITHIVADGFYGNISFINICQDLNLLVVSKLQSNSVLYYKYSGKYRGRGRPKVYGDKIDFKNLSSCHIVETIKQNDIITNTYHLKCMHRNFKREINVVIVRKDNLKTNKSAQVIFFSTDLNLNAQQIIKYYSSRFQIEFNFRDAKEFWGLEDFMNTDETAVNNAANLSFFMVLLSQILLEKFRQKENNKYLGIRDLISAKRADKYIFETFKLLKKFHPHILIPDNLTELKSLGRIHS